MGLEKDVGGKGSKGDRVWQGGMLQGEIGEDKKARGTRKVRKM